MTPEQFNTLLATISDSIAKIGTILIAIFSLWFQGRQENKRTEQAQKGEEQAAARQRDWSVEDRNISRKWLLTDRQLEEKKNYLLVHKRFVDDYIANLLLLTSRAYMRSIGFREDIMGEMKSPYILSLEHSTEIYHHIEAFDSAELRQQFQSLMTTVDEHLVPVLREPEKNLERIGNLRCIMAGATAPVTRAMENIIAEELQPRDWV